MSLIFNENSINKWYYNTSDLIKVYYHDAVCYYKLTPSGQTPCFAVVASISQYSDTEFIDVFNQADGKWYKLNNLNAYEEYGVYGSSTATTYYEGKLTVDNGYEYQYSGSGWNNVGAISGSSRVPAGYTEIEYISSENTSTSVIGPYIDTNFTPNQNTRVVIDYQASVVGQVNRRIFGAGRFNNSDSGNYIWSMEGTLGSSGCKYYYKFDSNRGWMTTSLVPDSNRHVVDFNKEGQIWIDNTAEWVLPDNTFTCGNHLGIFNEISAARSEEGATECLLGRVFSFQVYDSGTLVRDLVPCTNQNSIVGMYDVVNDDFYTTADNNYPFTAGPNTTGTTIYPVYYTEIQDPPNNISFTSMTEAEDYQCPWVGMHVAIAGVDYTFSGDSQSGYEWVIAPIDYSTRYLTLVAQTNNVSFKYDTATSSNKLQYSLDNGSTWSNLSNGGSTPSVNTGDKVLFKASGLTVNTERGVGRITPSSSATVEGNIMSLEYGDNFIEQTVIQNNYQFRKLFSGVTTITSAENMVIPATTVRQQCYSQMFQGCTSLIKTPKTVGSSAMTWSGQYCFSNMFSYCTSLTTPSSTLLPALNLGTQCYWYMFEGCSGLTTAPDLPAPNTASQCYQGMFKNCSSLNYIKVLSNSSFTMTEWVSGVASSGTFVKNPNATWSSCGATRYPCGWTVVDYSG